jgi:hypothetical protein
VVALSSISSPQHCKKKKLSNFLLFATFKLNNSFSGRDPSQGTWHLPKEVSIPPGNGLRYFCGLLVCGVGGLGMDLD